MKRFINLNKIKILMGNIVEKIKVGVMIATLGSIVLLASISIPQVEFIEDTGKPIISAILALSGLFFLFSSSCYLLVKEGEFKRLIGSTFVFGLFFFFMGIWLAFWGLLLRFGEILIEMF